jgi:hypothetical protein
VDQTTTGSLLKGITPGSVHFFSLLLVCLVAEPVTLFQKALKDDVGNSERPVSVADFASRPADAGEARTDARRLDALAVLGPCHRSNSTTTGEGMTTCSLCRL